MSDKISLPTSDHLSICDDNYINQIKQDSLAKGAPIPVENFNIDTPEGCEILQETARKFKELIPKQSGKINTTSLWKTSLKQTKKVIPIETEYLSLSLVSNVIWSDKSIEFKLYSTKDLSYIGKFVLSEDPKLARFNYSYGVYKWSFQWKYDHYQIFEQAARVLNLQLKTMPFNNETKVMYRKILIDNHNAIMESYKNAAYKAEDRKSFKDFTDRQLNKIQNDKVKHYPFRQSIKLSKSKITIMSHETIKLEQQQQLQQMLSNLPQNLKDFFDHTSEENPHDLPKIALLTSQEMQSITFENVAVNYSKTKIIYFNKEDLFKKDHAIEKFCQLMHELCHSVFSAKKNNWSFAAMFSSNENNSVFAESFKEMMKPNPNAWYDFQKTVSSFAGLNELEYAAETLMAYLYSKNEIYENGHNWFDFTHGLKSREELMQKNPDIYLAYEAFFSKDSPSRFDGKIFDDIKPIKKALSKAKGDLSLARQYYLAEL
ncbi:hypothetical protein BVY03_03230 [bacterium K02(2017)]|nr:hypothetical protein BVY03_03230 [bacterium K02(2017)]